MSSSVLFMQIRTKMLKTVLKIQLTRTLRTICFMKFIQIKLIVSLIQINHLNQFGHGEQSVPLCPNWLSGRLELTDILVTDEKLFDYWNSTFIEYKDSCGDNCTGNATDFDRLFLFDFFLNSYGEIDIRSLWFDFVAEALDVNFIFQPKTILGPGLKKV